MTALRQALWILVFAIFALGPSRLAPTASAQTFAAPRGEAQNVRFEQREDGIVHVLYDLISSEPRAVFSVRLEASQDGGATFAMQPQNITGDTGNGVTPGTEKRIVWDSGKDVERVPIDRFRFRIVATAGPLQSEPLVPGSGQDKTALPVEAPVPQATGKGGGGSKAKWLIPLVGGGGLAGVLGARGGGSANSAPAASVPAPPVIAAVQCRYTVSPSTFTILPAGGGTQSVSVSTTAGCAWTATSNAGFIAITGLASFVGNGTVTFSTESNTSTTTRTGTLSVAGEFVTVTQIQSGPDTVRIVGLSPPSGSTLGAGPTSVTGVTATVSYFLGSREAAFICVLPSFATAAQPMLSCQSARVTRGSGTALITFIVRETEPSLPVTTPRLDIIMGDTSQFGATTFLRLFESATFTWTRP